MFSGGNWCQIGFNHWTWYKSAHLAQPGYTESRGQIDSSLCGNKTILPEYNFWLLNDPSHYEIISGSPLILLTRPTPSNRESWLDKSDVFSLKSNLNFITITNNGWYYLSSNRHHISRLVAHAQSEVARSRPRHLNYQATAVLSDKSLRLAIRWMCMMVVIMISCRFLQYHYWDTPGGTIQTWAASSEVDSPSKKPLKNAFYMLLPTMWPKIKTNW